MSRWSPADEPMGSWIPHVPRSDWYSTVPAEDSRPIPHWRYNRLIKSVRGELRGRAEVVGAVRPCPEVVGAEESSRGSRTSVC